MHFVKGFTLLIALIISLISGSEVYADNGGATGDYDPANFTAPSPTAASLGVFGTVPVGKFTGTSQFNVPIYTLKSKYLSVPISLSYSSNGVKVDKVASWVGMDWSLNAGGVITRMVMDEADEIKPFRVPENPSDRTDENTLYYYSNYYGPNDNTQPDIYSFNFGSYSGKFLYSQKGELVLIPQQNLQVNKIIREGTKFVEGFEIVTPTGVTYSFFVRELSKTVSTCDGGVGDHSLKTTAWYLTSITHPSGDEITFKYGNSNYHTYYTGTSESRMEVFLENNQCSDLDTRCEAPDVDPVCYLQNDVTEIQLSEIITSQNGRVVFVADDEKRRDLDSYKLNDILVENAEGDLLKSISLNHEYADNRGLRRGAPSDMSLDSRLFLTGLSLKDNSGKVSGRYGFEYNNMNGLPVRLSFAKDHWGYFNGKNNETLMVKNEEFYPDNFTTLPLANREPDHSKAVFGMLKKITYPTGGSTEIEYEGNSYSERRLVYPPKETYNEFKENFSTGGMIGEVYTLEFNSPTQLVDLHLNVGSYAEEEDSRKSKSIAHYSLTDITDPSRKIQVADGSAQIDLNCEEGAECEDQSSSSLVKDVRLYEGHTYQLSLRVGAASTGDFSFSYYPTDPERKWVEVPIGGMRVKKLVNKGLEEDKAGTLSYHYGKHDDLSKSLGFAGAIPNYYERTITKRDCPGGTGNCFALECDFLRLASNSMHNLYINNQGSIIYPYVTEIRGEQGEGGAIEYHYEASTDDPSYPLQGGAILHAPYSNYGWNAGQEKEVTYLKKNKPGASEEWQVVRKVITEYYEDPRRDLTITGLAIRENFSNACVDELVFTCSEEGVKGIFMGYVCKAEHEHKYKHWRWDYSEITGILVYDQFRYAKCVVKGNMNEESRAGYCYGREVGDKINRQVFPENLDISMYQLFSKWSYPASVRTLEYGTDGEVSSEKVIRYEYDNPDHMLLSRQIMTDSRGRSVTTEYTYPLDYNQNAELNPLLENNIFNSVIDQRVSVDGKFISGKLSRYNPFGMPTEIKESLQDEGSLPDFDPGDPYTYGETALEIEYDDESRVAQYRGRDGIQVSYLWEDELNNPIAKIVGAAQQDVFYTGFEGDGNSADGKTGERSHQGSFRVTVPGPGSYNLSYWEKANLNAQWELIQKTITEDTDIGGEAMLIDEVRVHPSGVLMTTYTFKKGVGLSSVTDANQQTTYYEYDSSGRLQLIRDHEKQVLQTYEYHYTTAEDHK